MESSRQPLEGRVAVVTGAARNIGAAIASRLAQDGAATIVNYRSTSSASDAAAVVERICANGGRAHAIRADVGDEGDVDAMVGAARDAFGPPDILVNNAAMSVTADRAWHELTVQEWDLVLRANVTGGFICARALLPSMRERGGGSIVNISSVRVPLGRPGNLHYTASKAAQIGLTRALAREVGDLGIRVNAVIVGAIKTPDEAAYAHAAEIDEYLLSVQALGRRGVPDDIGSVVSFLCREDASFVTGQSLVVDGGWAMQ